jgi:murein L,D-transpeptidase YcbB/YkuD
LAAARLVLHVPAARLDVWQEGSLLRSYRVAVGAKAFPTPTGEFELSEITWNPWWVPPNSEWAKDEKPQPPGARNPMGRVKLLFGEGAYFLHGTSDTASLGRPASHGCVRMSNPDALELARFVVNVAGPYLPAATLDTLERATGLTRRVSLDCRVPLVVRYDLAEVRDTVLELYRDVYARGLNLRTEALTGLARAGFTTADINLDKLDQILGDGTRLPRRVPLRLILQPQVWRRWQADPTRAAR